MRETDVRSAPVARRLRRGISLAVVLGLAAVLPLAGPAAAAVFTNSTAITVGQPTGSIMTPGSPYPSPIAVSGLSGTVTDVNVTLCGFSATFPSDTDILLVAPNGTNAVVMSDVGGDGNVDPVVTNINITLDDSAANLLPRDSALASGTFRPLDDDNQEFDPDQMNTDVFLPPAPNPSDRLGVFRPSNGFWFWRTDSNNVELSSFNGVNPNGTWNLFFMDDVAASVEDGETQTPTLSCGWSIDVTAGGSGIPPGNGTVVQFGTTGDVAVPGDYDGNGSLDTAVFRASTGFWFIQNQGAIQFGASGDLPVPGDYDNDADTDIAVFRPSTGQWFIRGGSPGLVNFGTSGDVPVPADYDGDDRTDIAVFRPSSGHWFINNPLPPIPAVTQFGGAGDIPVPANYDRLAGTDNLAVFRPSNGLWFIQGSGVQSFGTNGDIPVPADYNNDGFVDVGVFRPSNGLWFIQGQPIVQFGAPGDQPIPVPPAIKLLFFP